MSQTSPPPDSAPDAPVDYKDQPDYKKLSRGTSRDMSPDAIARRLEIASELWDLAQLLSTSRYVGKLSAGPLRTSDESPSEPRL